MDVVTEFLYISIIVFGMVLGMIAIYTLNEENYYILKLLKVNKYGFNKDVSHRYLEWDCFAQYVLFNLLLKRKYRKEFEKYYKERYGIK